jgi:23S rRNA (cytidine2498-2'-O)-methyltransferase
MPSPSPVAAYLAAPDRREPLLHELGGGYVPYNDLFVGPPRTPPPAWALNTWHDVRTLRVDSIADAARQLRALGRNWVLHPYAAHRRAALIQARLPKVPQQPLVFGCKPFGPLGGWLMLDRHTLLAAPTTGRPFPHGRAVFLEDRSGPPGRAYLKLWESLTLLNRFVQPGERCVDLGASPGGWTWALAKQGAEVLALDKAPLDPRVAAMPGVRPRQQSAFGFDPAAEGPFDWLCCDVICYPDKLLTHVRRWLDGDAVRRFVVTVKFQGKPDPQTVAAFQDLPGRLLHLWNNKNELTWLHEALIRQDETRRSC